MAEPYFTIHTPVLNRQLPSNLHTFFYKTNIVLQSFILSFTSTITISPTDKENHFQLMIQILQIILFLTMIVKNNIILDNSTC